MKFHTLADIHQFLVEVDQPDLIPSVAEGFTPTPAMVELFLHRRKGIIGQLKNFRRSQAQKANWRKHKYKYMKGIKRFHTSTDGKKFHRSLGRFLATRDFRDGTFQRESLAVFSLHEVAEVLAAISSLRTHHFLELNYYHPLDEEVDYQLFGEELLPVLHRVELVLLDPAKELAEEDLDFFVRLVGVKPMTTELLSLCEGEKDDLIPVVDRYLNLDELPGVGEYLNAFNQLKTHLGQ